MTVASPPLLRGDGASAQNRRSTRLATPLGDMLVGVVDQLGAGGAAPVDDADLGVGAHRADHMRPAGDVAPEMTWQVQPQDDQTVVLAGVLDKIGTFGMIRFCLGLFPEASQWATPVVLVLALEPAHALARTGEVAREVGKGGDVVLLMSGRGDKDIFQVARHLGVEL